MARRVSMIDIDQAIAKINTWFEEQGVNHRMTVEYGGTPSRPRALMINKDGSKFTWVSPRMSKPEMMRWVAGFAHGFAACRDERIPFVPFVD